MAKLSAVVLAHNEYELLPKCLQSLSFADEVIVIDDSSTDQIAKITKNFNAKIYKRALNNDFSAQRNFALSKAKHPWVLFVDADEQVPLKLASEIKNTLDKSSADGFYIKRKDFWQGKNLNYGEFGNSCLLRLAKRDGGKWVRAVHEHWLINGNTKTLKNHMLHLPHPTVADFINKINYYSQLHAQENFKEGKIANFWRVLFYPCGKFFYYYFLKWGFLDGVHGFVAAVIMSMHSFLSWGSLWVNQNSTKFKNI